MGWDSRFLRNTKRLILSSFVSCFFFGAAYSQSIDNLKRERDKIQQEISAANNLLVNNKNEQRSIEENIHLLLTQIIGRQRIIVSINVEIVSLQNKIAETNGSIRILEVEIEKYKHEYELLLIELYKRRSSYDVLSYLLGSESFNQAFQRYRMIQELNTYRKRQVQVLVKSEQMLIDQRDNLLVLKQKLEEKLGELHAESNLLSIKKGEHESYIKTLKGQEKKLYSDIQSKKQKDEALENQILELIASVSKVKVRTSEGKDFGKNKGLLNSPVLQGVIVSNFGEHDHPVLKGVKVKNNGIDFKVDGSTVVQSIFEGEVSRIVSIPGYNKAVIIRHGKYLTVYANMEEVSVKSGDIVRQNQSIGRVFSGTGENSRTLHFEIWFENTKQNPEQWLKL
jgi:septal ring factor EnvC (AmiA/AmiB activator)